MLGRAAYHAFTYGWLASGLGRAITGMGMRELFRREVGTRSTPTVCIWGALRRTGQPKRADHVSAKHPGQPADRPPRAQARRAAGGWWLGAIYVPGITSLVQGDIPFLDSEIPSVNAVVTARGLAKMYAALANNGRINEMQFLSTELARGLRGKLSLRPDLNLVFPMSFHLGYHGSPVPGLLRGYGHAGLGGTIGWADPATRSSFAFVHNRLVTPIVLDQILFVPLILPLRRAIAAALRAGFRRCRG